MKFGFWSLFLIGSVILTLPIVISRSSEISADGLTSVPRIREGGFRLGKLEFVRVEAGDQSFPHITNGFMVADKSQSKIALPEFFISTTEIRPGDIDDVLDAACTAKSSKSARLVFSDIEISQLMHELNTGYLPISDGNTVSGRYMPPTVAMLNRAVFRGSEWQRTIPKGSVFSDVQSSLCCDRFSLNMNWSGGETGIGGCLPCDTGRLFHTILSWNNMGLYPEQNRVHVVDQLNSIGNDPFFNLGRPGSGRRSLGLLMISFVLE